MVPYRTQHPPSTHPPIPVEEMRTLLYLCGTRRDAAHLLTSRGAPTTLYTVAVWCMGRHLTSPSARKAYDVLKREFAHLLPFVPNTDTLGDVVAFHGGYHRATRLLRAWGCSIGVNTLKRILWGKISHESPLAVRVTVLLRYERHRELQTLPEHLREHHGPTTVDALMPLVRDLGGASQACRLLQSVGVRIVPQTLRRWAKRSPRSYPPTNQRHRWLMALHGMRAYIAQHGPQREYVDSPTAWERYRSLFGNL